MAERRILPSGVARFNETRLPDQTITQSMANEGIGHSVRFWRRAVIPELTDDARRIGLHQVPEKPANDHGSTGIRPSRRVTYFTSDTLRKNVRTSVTSNFGVSRAAKCPPRGISVQWIICLPALRWTQAFGGTLISFGNRT